MDKNRLEIKGWVARDKDGDICLFKAKPFKNEDIEMWQPIEDIIFYISKNLFPDVTWDSEPQMVKITIEKDTERSRS